MDQFEFCGVSIAGIYSVGCYTVWMGIMYHCLDRVETQPELLSSQTPRNMSASKYILCNITLTIPAFCTFFNKNRLSVKMVTYCYYLINKYYNKVTMKFFPLKHSSNIQNRDTVSITYANSVIYLCQQVLTLQSYSFHKKLLKAVNIHLQSVYGNASVITIVSHSLP